VDFDSLVNERLFFLAFFMLKLRCEFFSPRYLTSPYQVIAIIVLTSQYSVKYKF